MLPLCIWVPVEVAANEDRCPSSCLHWSMVPLTLWDAAMDNEAWDVRLSGSQCRLNYKGCPRQPQIITLAFWARSSSSLSVKFSLCLTHNAQPQGQDTRLEKEIGKYLSLLTVPASGPATPSTCKTDVEKQPSHLPSKTYQGQD